MTAEDIEESKKFRNNFFTQSGFSPLTELFQLPGHLDTLIERGEFISLFEREDDDTIVSVDRGLVGSIISYTYDLRYTLLKSRDMFSLSVSVPLTAGIYTGGYSNEGHISLGLKVPLSIDLNFYLHSTYNNISKTGIYIGAGYQRFQFLTGHNDSFQLPFARFGIKCPYRSRLVYLEIMYGRYANNQFSIEGELTHDSSQYMKITFGRLLKL